MFSKIQNKLNKIVHLDQYSSVYDSKIAVGSCSFMNLFAAVRIQYFAVHMC